MMRKFLLTTVSLMAISGTALAADLPSPRLAPPPPVIPIFTWTGFYLGVNAGAAFDDSGNDRGACAVIFGVGNCGFNDDRDIGFTGGGQIGYNWQVGTFVLGFEADAQYVDLDRGNFAIGGTGFFLNNRSIEWFGTARGRLGIAYDRALVYVTGGFAYGDGDSGFCGGGGGFGGGGCGDDFRTGFTVGGGIEYAFTPSWTVKIEGLYVNMDDGGGNVVAFNPATGVAILTPIGVGRNDEHEFFVVRAGLNYKFSY